MDGGGMLQRSVKRSLLFREVFLEDIPLILAFI